MRLLLLAIAVGAMLFLTLNLVNLFSQTSAYSGVTVAITDTLKGFQNSTEIPGLDELKKLYVTKIGENKALAEKNHTRWLWISFAVAFLTAASALVSSLRAAKKEESSDKRSLVLIAVFTFLATLGTWGANQFNESRNTALQKISTLSEQRTKFYADFQKAADDAQKADVVRQYKDNLDPL